MQGKGWVAAQDLKPNDKLELRDGEDAFVDAVRYEKLDKPIPVFNFEVEGFHTYYVGADCVLVHNKCGNHGESWRQERRKHWQGQGKLYKDNVHNQLSSSGTYKVTAENVERMLRGAAPKGLDGHSVALHHNKGILTDFYDYREILTSVHRSEYRNLHPWLFN